MLHCQRATFRLAATASALAALGAAAASAEGAVRQSVYSVTEIQQTSTLREPAQDVPRPAHEGRAPGDDPNRGGGQ